MNSKILNTKFVFLGTRGDTIYGCADQQNFLRKEQKTLRKAISQFYSFMDELEGINAFLVSTFSHYATPESTEEIKYHDWQKRIISLYIQLIADGAVYEDKINELQDMIDALQAIIEGFCENGSGVGARLSFYKSQITKLITEIKDACEQANLDFVYQPISHSSKKVRTIYGQIYSIVMKEYNKNKNANDNDDYKDGEKYNETDANANKNGTIADEIANALMNLGINDESIISRISEFANGKNYKFVTTTTSGKDIDYIADGVIDAQDISELANAIDNKDNLSDADKSKYDVNGDGELNKDDITAASEYIYKVTDDAQNTPSASLNNVPETTPTNDTPTENEPENPGENPTGDTPTENEPENTGENPTGDEPTGDDPTGNEPTGDDPTGDDPIENEPENPGENPTLPIEDVDPDSENDAD